MRGISIILGEEIVHTGNDLDLVQEEKEIGKPEIQSHTVEIPGRNGLLNLTKALTGKVAYSNRDLKFKYFGSGSRAELLALDEAMSRYHGETIRVIDDDYPDYYYEGEASVSTEFKPNYILISLKVDAQPFRLKRNKTVVSKTLSGETTLTLYNESIEAIPTITVTAETKIIFNGRSVTLGAGTYLAEAFFLHRGVNTLTVSGSGKITIEYQEGAI